MFGFIGNIGPWELLMVLFIVLLVFGPGKLPKVGESLGKALKSFKKAKDADQDDEFEELDSNKKK